LSVGMELARVNPAMSVEGLPMMMIEEERRD
jgi:hypothetical protein